MSTDPELIELESKVAFQDQTIEELSDVVFRLDKRIEKLELLCHSLKEKLDNFSKHQGLDVGDHDQKPPHY